MIISNTKHFIPSASLETPTEAEVGESEHNSENLEQSVWVASRGLSLKLVQIIRDY